MGAVASFDYAAFIAAYPEFQTLTAPQVQGYWDLATTFQRNDGGGPISTVAVQTRLLNLATAHIAQLLGGVNGEEPSPLVGRITSAGEGSVNVSTESSYPPGTGQWWQQTKYGSMWWAATTTYRRFRYIRSRTRVVDPWRPF